jgi:NTE family protein
MRSIPRSIGRSGGEGGDMAPSGPATQDDLSLVLTGGGARAAYQVGLLAHLTRRFPGLRIPILTGVSAGALNIGYLAAHQGTLAEAVGDLAELWRGLTPERIFRADARSLGWNAMRWATRLVSGGLAPGREVRGLLDTSPLRELLTRTLTTTDGNALAGIEANLRRGAVSAVALSSTNYSTEQSVLWVQGCQCQMWTRPQRKAVQATLTVDHIMASVALPFLFPAVRIGDGWHGDGGIRLTAPLSPAIHLGAGRILAISTRYIPTREDADRPSVVAYPPPAQMAGTLLNAIFLDVIDEDALHLRTVNQLLANLPERQHKTLRRIELLVLRPSRDLGAVALDYETALPPAVRYMMRGLGAHETLSADLLSLLLFHPSYLSRIMEIGAADAEANADEIAALLAT